MTRVLIRQHRTFVLVVFVWLVVFAASVWGAVASRFPHDGIADWSLRLLPVVLGVGAAVMVVPPEVRSGRSDMLWNHVSPRRWFTWQVGGFLFLAAVVGVIACLLSIAYFTIDPYRNGLFQDPGPAFDWAYQYPRWSVFGLTGPVVVARTVAAVAFGLAVGSSSRKALVSGVFAAVMISIAGTVETIARPLLYPAIQARLSTGEPFPPSPTDLSIYYDGTRGGGVAFYHPISQFWGMQLAESAILLIGAALLAVLAVYSFRRFTN